MYFRSTGFVQDIGYSNPDFDALVDEADTTVDPDVRMELYQQAQDLLVDDSPVVFMRNNVNSYLVKPWVTGVVTTPQDSIWPGAIDPISIDIDESMIP